MKLTDILHIIGDGIYFGARLTGLTGGSYVLGQIVVTNPGSNYTGAAPTVSFSGGGGTGAAADAFLLNNSVIEVVITAAGSGYTSAPGVTLTAPPAPGTTATANAILSPGTLDAIPTASRSLVTPTLVPIILSNQLNWYLLRAGTDAEASPQIIRPDDYNGATNQKVWELIGVAVGMSAIIDGQNLVLGTGTGTKIGTDVLQKLSFWNATPIIQPAHADQAALTDGTGGTPDGALVNVDTAGVSDPAKVNDNFSDVVRLLNQLRADLVAAGLIKGAA